MTQRPARVRDLGIVPGTLPTGPRNAITDVPGVLVGQTTVREGTDLRTGVTAVVPEAVIAATGARTVPAAVYVGNGHGKLVGSTQVDEFGVLESPIVLTATLSVFRAADAVLTYLMQRHPDRVSFNPVVGETNDGRLSDIRRRPITEAHVLDALARAGETVEEGCVGAGTGTTALGYKGGIGTSSRVVEAAGRTVHVGALVQSNFGGRLTVLGVPMPAEELLGDHEPDGQGTAHASSPSDGQGPANASSPSDGQGPAHASASADGQRSADVSSPADGAESTGNSCMIVVATDAPLDARRLGRLARRAIFAMARVGASFANGSGDYALAFGTAEPERPLLDDHDLDPVFAGVMDAVEEALLDSLFTATTTVGVHGRVAYAVPHAEVVRRLAERGLLQQ